MGWVAYIGIFFGLAGLFFVVAALALNWAARHGQLKHFEAGSRVIFDGEEEPEGVQTDYFPNKKRRAARKADAQTHSPHRAS